MATRVRDWATVDYYALLGVAPDASADDIARAFRAAAKHTHPDATDDPAAVVQFKELAAAYTVLSDRRSRRDYDRVRDDAIAPRLPLRAPNAGPPPAKPTRWNPRRAWVALVGGLVVTVLGIAVTIVTVNLHAHDADERAKLTAVIAERIDDGNIAFDTETGRHVVTREPHQHGEATGLGPTMKVRYDPADPQHVVVDAGTFGRDITLAIVAVKFLIGGPVFAFLGARYLRRRRNMMLRPTAAR